VLKNQEDRLLGVELKRNNEEIMMSKKAKRGQAKHEQVAEYYVSRLCQKPGFLLIEPFYDRTITESDLEIRLRGEPDAVRIRSNSQGKVFHTIYEWKGQNCPYLRRKMLGQHKRYARAHPEQNLTFVYGAPGVFEKIRLNF
jgi:hypothetical protein